MRPIFAGRGYLQRALREILEGTAVSRGVEHVLQGAFRAAADAALLPIEAGLVHGVLPAGREAEGLHGPCRGDDEGDPEDDPDGDAEGDLEEEDEEEVGEVTIGQYQSKCIRSRQLRLAARGGKTDSSEQEWRKGHDGLMRRAQKALGQEESERIIREFKALSKKERA